LSIQSITDKGFLLQYRQKRISLLIKHSLNLPLTN